MKGEEKKKKKGKEKDKEKESGRKKAAVQPAAKKAAPPPPEALLEQALQLVGGKWKLRILWALREGEPLRYSEVKRRVAGITDVMLSQSLKELAGNGLVERTQPEAVPARVTYRRTAATDSLCPVIEALANWCASLEM